MKSGESLNLRPFEKRLIVVVGLVLFIVLNFWFVIPHFKDWANVQFRMDKARRKLLQYQTEVRQMPVYQAKVRELGADNATVPVEEQHLHFSNTRESVAAQAGVNIASASKVTTRTNQFFLELTQTINLTCREQQLVDFLYNLGEGNSLIRVRELGLKPDPSGQQLSASVTLAASYQKKPMANRAEPPSAKPAVPRTSASPQSPSTSTKPVPTAAKPVSPATKPGPATANKAALSK